MFRHILYLFFFTIHCISSFWPFQNNLLEKVAKSSSSHWSLEDWEGTDLLNMKLFESKVKYDHVHREPYKTAQKSCLRRSNYSEFSEPFQDDS